MDIDYLALSLPGEALPDEGLATANLPMIVEMVDQALEGSVLLRKTAAPSHAAQAGDQALLSGPVLQVVDLKFYVPIFTSWV